jgi:hypothetical protein
MNITITTRKTIEINRIYYIPFIDFFGSLSKSVSFSDDVKPKNILTLSISFGFIKKTFNVKLHIL